MKPKKRQKLCYNCEGEVDLDVIVCPFCAADLRAEKPEQQKTTFLSASARPLNPQNIMSESLYPQPFAAREATHEEQPPAALPSPESSSEDSPRQMLGPTLLFALGAQLCLLGIFLFFFSHNGVLILKWDARMWFLYLFASVPLLIFGYRSLAKL